MLEICINECPYGYGYCSSKHDFEKCRKEHSEGCDGYPGSTGCAYAQGNALYQSMIHEGEYVDITCGDRCGCRMDPWEYAGWNRLCPFNDDADWQCRAV